MNKRILTQLIILLFLTVGCSKSNEDFTANSQDIKSFENVAMKGSTYESYEVHCHRDLPYVLHFDLSQISFCQITSKLSGVKKQSKYNFGLKYFENDLYNGSNLFKNPTEFRWEVVNLTQNTATVYTGPNFLHYFNDSEEYIVNFQVEFTDPFTNLTTLDHKSIRVVLSSNNATPPQGSIDPNCMETTQFFNLDCMGNSCDIVRPLNCLPPGGNGFVIAIVI